MARPEIRLHEGELNVMELLWANKVLAARDISKLSKNISDGKRILHIL